MKKKLTFNVLEISAIIVQSNTVETQPIINAITERKKMYNFLFSSDKTPARKIRLNPIQAGTLPQEGGITGTIKAENKTAMTRIELHVMVDLR
jgi:hypothetical protein